MPHHSLRDPNLDGHPHTTAKNSSFYSSRSSITCAHHRFRNLLPIDHSTGPPTKPPSTPIRPRNLTFLQMVERTQTTGSRGIRKRSSKFLAPEQVPRFHCDFCSRDISRKIRIKCAECNDFDLCVECFAVGVESQDHKKTHRSSFPPASSLNCMTF